MSFWEIIMICIMTGGFMFTFSMFGMMYDNRVPKPKKITESPLFYIIAFIISALLTTYLQNTPPNPGAF